jgi:hypothetical protein
MMFVADKPGAVKFATYTYYRSLYIIIHRQNKERATAMRSPKAALLAIGFLIQVH